MSAEFKSCVGCTRETNNSLFNCPIRGDYRLFTDWRPRCSTQYMDMINNNLPSSLEYRMFLTHNTDELIKKNAVKAYMKARCGPCVDNPDWNTGTMLPEFDSQECNSRTCSYRIVDPMGLGRQRKYFDNGMDEEVRKEFIKEKEKENEYFKEVSECCGTSSDNLYYYPIDGNIEQKYSRFAVPSGGALMRGGDRLM
jgi:hypothetical protein